jgi:hypothetical protein
MRVKFMFCLSGLAVAACMGESQSPPPTAPGLNGTVVYEAGPHLTQCSPPAVTRAQSAAKLTSAGIDVRRSSCGHIEGVVYPAVCGAGTGEILLHDIPDESLAAAEAAGFQSADTLNAWRRGTCPQYLHAIEMAQESATCAEIRNRVLLIQDAMHPDDRVVLLDQAGNCADAGGQQVLFGAAGDNVLCSIADSIAGPQKRCPVPSRAAMFDTILANLNQADLGLGSGYYVRQVYPGN